MALQTSGQMTLDDIANEFGISTSNLTLDACAAAAGVSTSNCVLPDSFYGKSAANVDLSGVPSNTTATGIGQAATAQYSMSNAGTHAILNNSTTTTLSPNWLTSGSASNMEVRFTVQSGDSYLHESSTSRGVWHNLGTTRYLLQFGNSNQGINESVSWTVELRVAGTSTVIATATSGFTTYRAV